MSYYLELKIKSETIAKTEWIEHIYDIGNARNRAIRWFRNAKKSYGTTEIEVEIREQALLYSNENGKLIETITKNPYEK